MTHIRKVLAQILRKAAQRLDPQALRHDRGQRLRRLLRLADLVSREHLLRDQRVAMWADLQGYTIVGEHGSEIRLRDYGI